jgi:hypothetical protein
VRDMASIGFQGLFGDRNEELEVGGGGVALWE